jgi:serine O-acetyltransferase
MKAETIYFIGRWFYNHGFKFVARLFEALNYLLHISHIPSSAEIGKGTKFVYRGISVVIHARAKIGKNCIIGQCVTIGGKSGSYEVPIIGNNVYIGPGARIIGNIVIGDNSIIGANAVVVKDVPPYSVVGGGTSKGYSIYNERELAKQVLWLWG